jgi:signal transduction histidine kinase
VGSGAGVTLSTRGDEFAANMTAMAGLFAGAHLLARQIRGWSAHLENARAEAITEGVSLATEQERSRQLRILHDSALQTLEAVSSARFPSLDIIRARVEDEAQRLRLVVEGQVTGPATIAEAVERVVEAHRGQSLRIDLTVSGSVAANTAVISALCDACHEALTNVAKHSGTGAAHVHVDARPDGVRIVVEDAGTGFAVGEAEGFGIKQSIHERLAEVAGRAEINSAPGHGTRVVLWGPA